MKVWTVVHQEATSHPDVIVCETHKKALDEVEKEAKRIISGSRSSISKTAIELADRTDFNFDDWLSGLSMVEAAQFAEDVLDWWYRVDEKDFVTKDVEERLDESVG